MAAVHIRTHGSTRRKRTHTPSKLQFPVHDVADSSRGAGQRGAERARSWGPNPRPSQQFVRSSQRTDSEPASSFAPGMCRDRSIRSISSNSPPARGHSYSPGPAFLESSAQFNALVPSMLVDSPSVPPSETPSMASRRGRLFEDSEALQYGQSSEAAGSRLQKSSTKASLPSSSRVSRTSVANSVFSYAVGEKAVWQWEHRTGFRSYETKECERIEQAYMQGHDCVRLKTGKWGSTPMELFFVDMIQHDPITGNSRRIRRLGREGFFQWMQRTRRRLTRFILNGSMRRRDFKHYEQMRREIYNNIDQKDYNVHDFYKRKGFCAYVAKMESFFALSMLAVVLSAIWTAVDADQSSGPDAPSTPSTETMVIDNIFCGFFTLELLIRFGAFQLKKNCLQDWWFMFDSFLLAPMIAETWVLPIIILSLNHDSDGNAPGAGLHALRVARLVRLTRLGRIARLVRVVPEVMTLLKGIAAATRSVLVTLMLLLASLFLFGVVFRMQAGDDAELSELLPTVPEAMMLLLMHGTLLDSPASTLDKIGKSSGFLVFLFLLYIFLSSFTILNMLIGILCGVVSAVDEAEHEQAAVQFLKSTLLDLLECHDQNDDRAINNQEFELLMNNPEVHLILCSFGVDVADLLSLKELLFHNKLLKSAWADEDSSDDDEERLTMDVGITVVRARGLPAGDVGILSASSDPYVVVDRPGKATEEFRTAVVSCSLDPVWNHTGIIRDYSSNESIRFSVYDRDWAKEDDLLGEACLEFQSIYPGGFEGEVNLLGRRRQASKSQGVLTLKVEIASDAKRKIHGDVGEPVLTFAEFLEVVLRLRGDKSATVHDVVELRHSMIQGFNHLDALMGTASVGTSRKDAAPLSNSELAQVETGLSKTAAGATQAQDEALVACLEELQSGQLALRAELEQMANAHSQKYEEMAFKVRHLHRHVQQLHDAVLAPAEVPPLLPGLSPEIGSDEGGDDVDADVSSDSSG